MGSSCTLLTEEREDDTCNGGKRNAFVAVGSCVVCSAEGSQKKVRRQKECSSYCRQIAQKSRSNLNFENARCEILFSADQGDNNRVVGRGVNE
jgi:glutaminase